MNEKGFTLIEILAVVSIIALITIVAVPSALTFQENMNKKMFCSKIETIETSARLYGNDIFDTIKNYKEGESNCEGADLDDIKTNCTKLTVKALLLKGYLKKEESVEPGSENGKKTEYYDPRDDKSIRDTEVLIFIDDNMMKASYIFKNEADLDLCHPIESTPTNSKLYYKNGTAIKRKRWS